MARPRSKNKDLPTRLYRQPDGAYQYYRPDTRRKVRIGKDKDLAIETAECLNKLFSVERLSSFGVNLTTKHYRRAFELNYGKVPLTELARHALRDLFAPAPSEVKEARKKLNAWYEHEEPARFRGNRWIRTSDLKPEIPPGWVQELFRNTRKNAMKRRIPFELTIGELVTLLRETKGECVVTGVKLRHDKVEGRHTRRPWAPSIDRIDSKRGYSKENCRIVCVAANLAMSQWGEEVLFELAKNIAKRKLKIG